MFSVDHIALSVKNLEKSIKFYSMLGFKFVKKFEAENLKITLLNNEQNVSIELFSYKNFNPLPEHAKNIVTDLPTIGTKHFALRVEDINKAAKFLIDNKLTNDVEITEGRLGRKYFFIKDPNEILIEIIEKK